MITVSSVDNKWTDAIDLEALFDSVPDDRRFDEMIKVIKGMPVNGCITGSSFLPGFSPYEWSDTPDIDLFVYSESDLIKAITLAQYSLGMTPGTGDQKSYKQECWKLDRLFSHGLNRKTGITTYKFSFDGIVLNITYKKEKVNGMWQPLTNAVDVISSFDMSIVMQAFDLRSQCMIDLRPTHVPTTVAIPNPLRNVDYQVWDVAKWVRQFDRVVKYYNRGFDTRPMAEFYLELIDNCIEQGCLFTSEESIQTYKDFVSEFEAKREVIDEWLRSV